jgi:hypothetical protein
MSDAFDSGAVASSSSSSSSTVSWRGVGTPRSTEAKNDLYDSSGSDDDDDSGPYAGNTRHTSLSSSTRGATSEETCNLQHRSLVTVYSNDTPDAGLMDIFQSVFHVLAHAKRSADARARLIYLLLFGMLAGIAMLLLTIVYHARGVANTAAFDVCTLESGDVVDDDRTCAETARGVVTYDVIRAARPRERNGARFAACGPVHDFDDTSDDWRRVGAAWRARWLTSARDACGCNASDAVSLESLESQDACAHWMGLHATSALTLAPDARTARSVTRAFLAATAVPSSATTTTTTPCVRAASVHVPNRIWLSLSAFFVAQHAWSVPGNRVPFVGFNATHPAWDSLVSAFGGGADAATATDRVVTREHRAWRAFLVDRVLARELATRCAGSAGTACARQVRSAFQDDLVRVWVRDLVAPLHAAWMPHLLSTFERMSTSHSAVRALRTDWFQVYGVRLLWQLRMWFEWCQMYQADTDGDTGTDAWFASIVQSARRSDSGGGDGDGVDAETQHARNVAFRAFLHAAEAAMEPEARAREAFYTTQQIGVLFASIDAVATATTEEADADVDVEPRATLRASWLFAAADDYVGDVAGSLAWNAPVARVVAWLALVHLAETREDAWATRRTAFSALDNSTYSLERLLRAADSSASSSSSSSSSNTYTIWT